MRIEREPWMLAAEAGMLTFLRLIRRRPPGPSTRFPKLAIFFPPAVLAGEVHRRPRGSIARAALFENGTARIRGQQAGLMAAIGRRSRTVER